MVRELFEMARMKQACIVFFDEIDAVGGTRFDDGAGGDNEVQRTMLELINQLDGFDPRGNIKVLMATNRPDNSGSRTNETWPPGSQSGVRTARPSGLFCICELVVSR
jgi:SpoVK/Ycf46/Vps4 family AAA+-type ATPase